jgi:hypothetical protein
MDHILEFSSFGQRVVILTSRQGREIKVTIQGHSIKDIVNESGINFPFSPGQSWTRTVETWACTNGFKIDGKDPCPEEKIFGIRKKDIPQGHELRMLFPHKFR